MISHNLYECFSKKKKKKKEGLQLFEVTLAESKEVSKRQQRKRIYRPLRDIYWIWWQCHSGSVLTLDTLGQAQSPLNIPADGFETVLELLVTVMLLAAAGVVAAIVPVTAFGHGGDAHVKLEKDRFGMVHNLSWQWLQWLNLDRVTFWLLDDEEETRKSSTNTHVFQ